jgi:rfaE bifunctional protein nucleotidyltransferase chain/domain
MNKLVTKVQLVKIIDTLRAKKKTIVFTNGCFDILHVGHIRYLQQAKSMGDILIVGVNSDESAKKIKGEPRPIVPENERSEIIAALNCVDYVTIFSETTPDNLICLIKPDIHVKGGDWKIQHLPEAKLVQSYGGKVIIANHIEGHSTTNLLKEILEKHKKRPSE